MGDWTKLPPAKDIHIGCSNCSTAARQAPLDMLCAVGFGACYVKRDKDKVYSERPNMAEAEADMPTLQKFEDMAKADPDHDWRLVKVGAMHGETFQRQGDGLWICVESNEGFA